MASRILFPITREAADEAVAAAPDLVRQAAERGAAIVVLQTECLHGLFTDIEEDYEVMESHRILAAAERVATALREHGADVEVVWECIQIHHRPVDVETATRHGADAVYALRHHGLAGMFESMSLRRLRRHGITVLRREPAATPA